MSSKQQIQSALVSLTATYDQTIAEYDRVLREGFKDVGPEVLLNKMSDLMSIPETNTVSGPELVLLREAARIGFTSHIIRETERKLQDSESA